MFKIYKTDSSSRFDTLVEGIKNILEFECLYYKIIMWYKKSSKSK